jgi:RNA polymerase sigma-70 factor (ECF subfamily)
VALGDARRNDPPTPTMGGGRSRSAASQGPDGRRTTIDEDSARWLGPGGALDERAVVQAVLGGDRDAYRRLVERDAPAVIRACHRVLGDLSEAEDAAQEAFVTAYRSLATWRGDGPFAAWLTRIAVRIALRQAGKRTTVAWRSPEGSRGDDPGMPSPADRAIDRASMAAAPWTDPAQVAVRAEHATEIRAAVTALPEPYREVVALRFFAEASLDEIARQTERPLGTVKTHLHRGLARLRQQLEGADR